MFGGLKMRTCCGAVCACADLASAVAPAAAAATAMISRRDVTVSAAGEGELGIWLMEFSPGNLVANNTAPVCAPGEGDTYGRADGVNEVSWRQAGPRRRRANPLKRDCWSMIFSENR